MGINSNLVEDAVNELMKRYKINKEDKILIKPNFVSMDPYPYTTDRNVIEEVVLRLRNGGCKDIIVADAPSPDYSVVYNKEYTFQEKKEKMNAFNISFRQTKSEWQEDAYINSVKESIDQYYEYYFTQKQCMNYGGCLNAKSILDICDEQQYMDLKITSEISARCVNISMFDVVINLPVLKLHTTTGFTGATKNFYAIFSTKDKLRMHKYGVVGEAIKSLYKYIKPIKVITLLDCRYIASSQQLIWGNGKIYEGRGWILSDDLLETDMVAKQLLEELGLQIKGKDLVYADCLNKLNENKKGE